MLHVSRLVVWHVVRAAKADITAVFPLVYFWQRQLYTYILSLCPWVLSEKNSSLLDISKFGAHCQYHDENSHTNTMSGRKLECLSVKWELSPCTCPAAACSLRLWDIYLWQLLDRTVTNLSLVHIPCKKSMLSTCGNKANSLSKQPQLSNWKQKVFQSPYILIHQIRISLDNWLETFLLPHHGRKHQKYFLTTGNSYHS